MTPEYLDCGLGRDSSWPCRPSGASWTENEVHPDVRNAYEKLLSQLREMQLDKGKDGEREPFAVRLTTEAKAAWVAFYGEWAKEQAAVEGELAAAYSKLEGYAARLALIHHVVSRVGDMEDCQPIEAVSIEAGVTMARWFGYEMRRHLRRLGRVGGRPEDPPPHRLPPSARRPHDRPPPAPVEQVALSRR